MYNPEIFLEKATGSYSPVKFAPDFPPQKIEVEAPGLLDKFNLKTALPEGNNLQTERVARRVWGRVGPLPRKATARADAMRRTKACMPCYVAHVQVSTFSRGSTLDVRR